MIEAYTVVICFESAEQAFQEIDVYEEVSICYGPSEGPFIAFSLEEAQEHCDNLSEVNPDNVYKVVSLTAVE